MGDEEADQSVEIIVGGDEVSAANPLPVSGTFVTSGQVEITNDIGNPIPVDQVGHTATPGGNDIVVDGTVGGVTLLAANASRRSATIQNTSAYPMRVGIGENPGAATGFYLQAYDLLITDSKDAIKAIRTTANSATAFAQGYA